MQDLYSTEIISIFFVLVVGIDENLNGTTKPGLVMPAVFMQECIGWHICVILFDLCLAHFPVH